MEVFSPNYSFCAQHRKEELDENSFQTYSLAGQRTFAVEKPSGWIKNLNGVYFRQSQVIKAKVFLNSSCQDHSPLMLKAFHSGLYNRGIGKSYHVFHCLASSS